MWHLEALKSKITTEQYFVWKTTKTKKKKNVRVCRTVNSFRVTVLYAYISERAPLLCFDNTIMTMRHHGVKLNKPVGQVMLNLVFNLHMTQHCRLKTSSTLNALRLLNQPSFEHDKC